RSGGVAAFYAGKRLKTILDDKLSKQASSQFLKQPRE
ncbi:unnamed protein product, partial [marine sediment metagenome]